MQVEQFIRECVTCQQVKPFNTAPQGQLQPLKLPGHIWECISMDFITHLPPSQGRTIILVVVDRLSKYSHFSALGTHITAPMVAEVFMRDICRLHGMPLDIVSDRDPLFVSQFWRELFRLQGTQLFTSSAYHPQSDGQIEVVNRCLKDYLRCFSADNPRTWNRFLALAEWNYNTSKHSAIGMTLFEAIYGRSPPSLADYIGESTTIASLEELLGHRTQLLSQLRANMQRAQLRMKNQVDQRRMERSYHEGDWVFVKLQPYRQSLVASPHNHKLAKRFYGPFHILQKIGPTAYKLELPPEAKIQNVFHVSLLRKCHSDPTLHSAPLPPNISGGHLLLPKKVLGYRRIMQAGKEVHQILVQWQSQPLADATWELQTDIRKDYPELDLEDKVELGEGSNDTT